MRKISVILCLSLTTLVQPAVGAGPVHVHLIGDSTISIKPLDLPNPERGWGQMLPLHFRDPTVVINAGRNGRSARSFIEDGSWAKVVPTLQAEDWVIIQFGHNDASPGNPKTFTDPATTYRDYLRRMIRDVRAAGAFPILATPTARREYGEDGRMLEMLGAYCAAARAVATEEQLPLLDIDARLRELLLTLGPEGARALYLHFPPGMYARYPKGKADDLHLSILGASRVAEIAVGEIRRLALPIQDLLR